MSISIRGTAGAWVAANATTQTVTLPTHVAGDMLIVRVGMKHATMPSTITCATAGWTKAGQHNSGTTASANNSGSVIVAVFYKEATSAAETNPVITYHASVAATPSAASPVVYQKASTESWGIAWAAGTIAAATAMSATMGTHISTLGGDMVDVTIITNDNTTLTVPTVTQAGVTFGTVSEQPATALSDATSNDIAADGAYRLASSGTSSAAAVVTGTNSIADEGAAATTVLRVFPLSLDAYRFRKDDGNETTATWWANENTAATLSANQTFRLRVLAQVTQAVNLSLRNFRLEVRRNSGAWDSVATSGAVTTAASGNFTGPVNTTDQMTGGTGGFGVGQLVESTALANAGPASSAHTQLEYTLTLVSPVTGDVFEFRLYDELGRGLIPSTVVPTLNYTVSATTVNGSFTADAYIKKTIAQTFTADANIKATVASSLTADSFIKATISGSFTSDAFLRKTDIAGSFTADAYVRATSAGTFTADGHIKATVASSVTADAFIQRLGLENSFTADAYLKKLDLAGTFTADADISKQTSGSFTSDAFIRKTLGSTFTADATIKATVASSFTADAYILRTFWFGEGAFE